MLNEFDYKFWRSLKSLLAETQRPVRLATNISQVFDNFFNSLLYKFQLVYVRLGILLR